MNKEILDNETSKGFIQRRKDNLRNKKYLFGFIVIGCFFISSLLLFLSIYVWFKYGFEEIPVSSKMLFISSIIIFLLSIFIITPRFLRNLRKQLFKITSNGIYPTSPKKRRYKFIKFEEIRYIEFYPGYGFRLNLKDGKEVDIPSDEIGSPKEVLKILEDLEKVLLKINRSD